MSILGANEDELTSHTRKLVRWPLEYSLSVVALAQVEFAVRARLSLVRGGPMPEHVQAELRNLANVIRAHLQHVKEESAEPTDEELLA